MCHFLPAMKELITQMEYTNTFSRSQPNSKRERTMYNLPFFAVSPKFSFRLLFCFTVAKQLLLLRSAVSNDSFFSSTFGIVIANTNNKESERELQWEHFFTSRFSHHGTVPAAVSYACFYIQTTLCVMFCCCCGVSICWLWLQILVPESFWESDQTSVCGQPQSGSEIYLPESVWSATLPEKKRRLSVCGSFMRETLRFVREIVEPLLRLIYLFFLCFSCVMGTFGSAGKWRLLIRRVLLLKCDTVRSTAERRFGQISVFTFTFPGAITAEWSNRKVCLCVRVIAK